MNDALKAAVRGALKCAWSNFSPDDLNVITSALARRGVVVTGEEQKRSIGSLIDARNVWLKRLEEIGITPEESRLLNALDLCLNLECLQMGTCDPAPSESPVPKPARKAEFTQNHEALLLEIGKAAQTLVWGTRHMHGLNDAMKPFAALPIPQPGDEQ
jgi:hypothetical protein